MGRPLYSASYSTPAVRTEPEIAPPTASFEKWTYWNPFDPDSDEFFERADAVYEAFIDPADVPPATAERETDEPERLAAIIARELEEDSTSSEGTISGRGSPMADGSDDPSGMLVDAYRAGEFEPRTQSEAAPTPGVTNEEYQGGREEISIPPLRDVSAPVMSALDLINSRRVSRVMPLSPFRSRGFIPYFPPSSTTPPPRPSDVDQVDDTPGHNSTYEWTSPSPVPTVTPRLYSWSSRTPLGRVEPGSPSPPQRSRPSPPH